MTRAIFCPGAMSTKSEHTITFCPLYLLLIDVVD